MVTRVKPGDNGNHIVHAKGLSELVKDQQFIFDTEIDSDIAIVNPKNMKFVPDTFNGYSFLSSGQKIFFNHTSEVKIFDFCNETMQMISAAIRVLTEEYLDGEKKRIIHKHLRTVPEEEFRKDITIPPAWVGEIIMDIWKN